MNQIIKQRKLLKSLSIINLELNISKALKSKHSMKSTSIFIELMESGAIVYNGKLYGKTDKDEFVIAQIHDEIPENFSISFYETKHAFMETFSDALKQHWG